MLSFLRNDRLALVAGAAAFFLSCTLAGLVPAGAVDLKTYSKKAAYKDVRFELTNVIVSRGLKVDLNGNVGAMLARTGADVGSTKPVYKNAEYFIFCSAKLTRAMLEADAAAMGHCPYVVYIYETSAKPGVIMVGYKKPPLSGGAAASTAFAAIETLLDGIARDAVK